MAERRLSGNYVPTTRSFSRPVSPVGSPRASHSDDEHLSGNDPSVQAADQFVAPRLDKADILQRIQLGNYTDPIDLFRSVQNPQLSEQANATLLSAAAADVLQYAFEEVHSSAFPAIEALLRPLIGGGARQPAQPEHGGPVVEPADATGPLPTVGRGPAFNVKRAVDLLSQGRYDGSRRVMKVIFGRREGATLIRALNQIEEHLASTDHSELSAEQRQRVVDAIKDIRAKDPSLGRRQSVALPALRQSTKGGALSNRYSTDVQRELVHKLTFDRQNLVIDQARNEALDAVLDWHLNGGSCPPLLNPDDPEGSVNQLRLQAAKRRPDMDSDRQRELTQAIDHYKAVHGIMTPRDRADLAWVKRVAGKDNASPGAALEDLLVQMRSAGHAIPLPPAAWDPTVPDEAREAMQTEAAVAQALSTALARASELSEAERCFLYQMTALLVGKANKPLWAIAHPTREPGEPHKLNPVKPYLPAHPDNAQRARFNQGVDRAAAHQRKAKEDVRHVLVLLSKLDRTKRKPGAGNLFVETTLIEQCTQLLATANCSPSRVRYALYLISKGGGSKGRVAAKLLDEMRYSLREATGSNLPMTNGEIFQHFLQGLGNCFMEGGSHYAASVVIGLTAHAMGPFSSLLVVGSLGLQMYSLGWLESQKTEEYNQQPSRTAELLLATPYLVAPAAALCGIVKLIDNIGYFPVALPATFGRSLEFFVIIRFLRQLPQSWLRNRHFAGFQVRHADGSGLTAGEQFQLNICRDIGYLVFGGICLYFGPTLTAQVLEALGVVGEAAATEGEKVITILVTYLWAALAEFLDGGIPDWFKLLYRAVKGNAYMLQPGTQANPGLNPTHYLKNATSRGVANGLSDFFNGLADMFKALGLDELAELCRVFAIIWNGLAGSLRTRFADYLTTGETLADNGSKNPAGLMTALGMLAVDMGQCVAGAASGFANNVATAVAGLGTAPVAAQPEGTNERQPTGEGDIELQPVLERRTPSDDEPVDNDSVEDEPSGNDEEFFDMVKKL
jgi:hypothetical protein